MSCGSSGATSYSGNPHAQKHQQAHQDFALQSAQKELIDDFIKDITGTYNGNIPCADCESIQYQLRLYENLSYTLKLLYKGKSDQITQIDGVYSLTDNFLILLDQKAGTMNYLKKVDKGLLLLDKTGAEIQGETADNYLLGRVN
jgi:uncharacterized lipoprotein NlpE involved in copper resistance